MKIEDRIDNYLNEATKKMTHADALKNLDKGILDTTMLEPLGIDMDTFLTFSKQSTSKQKDLIKKLAHGFKSSQAKNPDYWKKLGK